MPIKIVSSMKIFLSTLSLRKGLGSTLSVAFVMALQMMSSAYAAESITFYHNDILGSPVAVTDVNGNLCWRENYRPYGEKLLNVDEPDPVNPLCGLDDNQRGYTHG